MLSKRLAHAAVTCAVLTVGVTACGGSTTTGAGGGAAAAPSPSASSLAVDTLGADEIEKQAKAAMTALASLKVDGTMTVEGKKMTISLAADKKGDCAGTIGLGADGTIDLIRTGSQSWLKPDAAFWKSMAAKEGADAKGSAAVAELFKGRYIANAGSDAQVEELAGMCDLVKGLGEDDGSTDKAVKGKAGDVNGVKTISLDVTDSDGQVNTIQVATEGKPYLIKLEQTAGAEPGEMVFSDFDKPLTVQAPPADNVIDFSVFQQKLKTA
ncbi:hypothetical protein [Kitasatospora sp. NBC_00315]|uniref:hypothetical protein n=1 Tax=Kitasatospora sp. NBC_00315 TaxID=2975963 RepID=UPI003250A5E3